MNQSDKEQINQLDGLYTFWYENGQKKWEITFKDGLKRWNEDGSVKE